MEITQFKMNVCVHDVQYMHVNIYFVCKIQIKWTFAQLPQEGVPSWTVQMLNVIISCISYDLNIYSAYNKRCGGKQSFFFLSGVPTMVCVCVCVLCTLRRLHIFISWLY